MPDPNGLDAPTVIILYGGTGDLAKRMVLPAIYELFARDLLPKQFRLVGNGRGDVAHEDFRVRVRESLDEFGGRPRPVPVRRVRRERPLRRRRVRQVRPGQPARRDRRGRTAVWRASPSSDPLPGRAAQRVRPDDRGHRRARPGRERQGGLREAVRHLHRELPRAGRAGARRRSTRSRSTGSTTSSGRRRPRTCTWSASPTGCSGTPGAPSTWPRSRSTCPRTLDIDDRAEFYDATGAALDMLARSRPGRICSRWRPRSPWSRR